MLIGLKSVVNRTLLAAVMMLMIAGVLTSAVLAQAAPVSLCPIPASDALMPAVSNLSRSTLSLSQDIHVTIKNGSPLLNCAHLRNARIELALDDSFVDGVFADTQIVPDAAGSINLHFFVPHSSAATALWSRIIREKRGDSLLPLETTVPLSVGIVGSPQMFVRPMPVRVILATATWLAACCVTLILFLAVFLWMAIKTDLLRAGAKPSHGRRPFSLARTQMAAWFVTILTSWLALYVFIHAYDTITSGLLVLMGISAATAVAGATIDARAVDKELATGTTELPPSNKISAGFVTDLLTDSARSGISFHRFQMAAWTVVLILVFVRQVFAYYRMPDFDTSLLTLMGISSSTYVGLKIAET